MIDDLHAVIDRYRTELQEPDDPAAEPVTVLLSTFPHRDRSV